MWLDFTALAALTLAATGCLYALFAAAMARGWVVGEPATGIAPSVTVLKPLHGAEPHLYDNLASFCRQRYAGRVQILFGVQDPADPAAAAVRRLIAERPDLDLELVVTRGQDGANPKVANLAGLQRHIAHDVVVVSDSDIAVPPDYLARIAAALDRPGAGLVTCLYRGQAQHGLWSRLAAMAIDHHFLPGVLVGLRLGLAHPCFGSTLALRRDTLTAIGGFDAFRDRLADDYAIGVAVRGRGLQVVVPRFAVAHTCAAASLRELWRHELRWARTVRLVSPWGYAGSVVTHPLPFALLAACVPGYAAAGAIAVVLSISSRHVLMRAVEHTFGTNTRGAWLGPVRDLLSFAIFVASFFVAVVSWRGRRYRVRHDNTLAVPGEPHR